MSSDTDYIELVKTAQLGDERSLECLAKLARERLRVYVYRLALEEDSTQDIVQETMLEMFKTLGKLKSAERFWSWLYAIALNKSHRHYRTARRHKAISMSQAGPVALAKDKQERLENLVGRELKQVVSSAMRALTARHRAVLCMRCYDEMSYPEIAESLGCSEMAARMLFYRAKVSLQKQLSRHGLGKGSLLLALTLFGKMTAPNEAAAASLSVTAASTKVGVAAGVAVVASSKTVIVPLVTAGALTVGAVVATSGPDAPATVGGNAPVVNFYSEGQGNRAAEVIDEWWYYFPQSADGPVMLWAVSAPSKGEGSYYLWRQSEKGNSHFDRRSNTV
ncbi:MAG: RNA polymerase sigma factor, partial [Planctomycetota bacterium]